MLRSTVIGLVLMTSNAWGWGQLGHTVVGVIAQNHLNNDTKKAVKQLLGKDSLGSVSTWADSARQTSAWSHTSGYHFDNISDNSDLFKTLQGMSPEDRAAGETVLALLKCEDVLLDKKASDADRQVALKFMVHFVGDLHQPLHSGRPEDRGGNSIDVVWFGTKTNLHSIWDTKILQKAYEKDIQGLSLLEQAKKVASLLDTVDSTTVNKWTSSFMGTWLTESLNDRPFIYSGVTGDQNAYLQKSVVIVQRRILQASYRLASWLNALFGPNATLSQNSQTLRAQLKKILGSQMDSIISLKPNSKAHFAPMTIDDHDDDQDQ